MGSKSYSSSNAADNRQAATDNALVAGVSGSNSTLGLATLSGISNAGDVTDTKGGALLKNINSGSLNYETNQTTNITDGGAFDLVSAAVNKAVDLSRSTTSEALAAIVNSQKSNAEQSAKLFQQSADTVKNLVAQQQAAVSNLAAQQTASGAALADGIVGMAAKLSQGLQNGLDTIGVGFNSLGESLNASSAAEGAQAQKNAQYIKYMLMALAAGLGFYFLKGKK